MGQEVIIKIFKQQKIFLREAKYMTRAGAHPNLIKVFEILKDTKIVTYKKGKKVVQTVNAIIMEKGKVDLFLLINKCERFTEMTCRYFFKKLLSAIEHCHNQGVAHCDLKLENIIFDRFGNVKLIDFGLAHSIQNKGFGSYRKLLGTYGYMAPEIHKSELYNIRKADLFSLAVILFIMVYGSPPFAQANAEDSHYYLMQTETPTYLEFMDDLGDAGKDFQDLILRMLDENPKRRLTNIDEIKNHPWYSGKTSTFKEAILEVNAALLKSPQ